MRKLVFIGWLFLSFSAACAQKLHIMTYNIHHGADRNEVNTLDSIGYFIKSQNPDIVGLQEVDSVCTRSERIDQMKRLAEITGMHYAFVRHFPYQGGAYRSEEHTSELQSRENLVCRLLLEKKK